ncbi:hypothetical protein ACF0H5_007266 [Mactra antiquata]
MKKRMNLILKIMITCDDEDSDPDSNEFYGRDCWYNQYEEENADFNQFLVQISPKESSGSKVKSNDYTGDKMDDLMFGSDCLSRLAYQRKLPLKEELGAVVMDGYNTVGNATTAALIPMLTGETKRNYLKLKEPDVNWRMLTSSR